MVLYCSSQHVIQNLSQRNFAKSIKNTQLNLILNKTVCSIYSNELQISKQSFQTQKKEPNMDELLNYEWCIFTILK